MPRMHALVAGALLLQGVTAVRRSDDESHPGLMQKAPGADDDMMMTDSQPDVPMAPPGMKPPMPNSQPKPNFNKDGKQFMELEATVRKIEHQMLEMQNKLFPDCKDKVGKDACMAATHSCKWQLKKAKKPEPTGKGKDGKGKDGKGKGSLLETESDRGPGLMGRIGSGFKGMMDAGRSMMGRKPPMMPPMMPPSTPLGDELGECVDAPKGNVTEAKGKGKGKGKGKDAKLPELDDKDTDGDIDMSM